MPTKPKSGKMPKWRPAPDWLIEVFNNALMLFPEAEVRKTFGYPSSFANGNMFAGLHQESLVLRLSDQDRARFLELKGARQFEPMPGRLMREYVVVPEAVLKSEGQLNTWLGRAFAYTTSLPHKARKAKRTGSPGTTASGARRR